MKSLVERAYEMGRKDAKIAWDAGLRTDEDRRTGREILEALTGLTEEEKRSAIAKMIAEKKYAIEAVQRRTEYLESKKSSLETFLAWVDSRPSVMQSPQGSAWHKLLAARKDGSFLVVPDSETGWVDEFFSEPPQVFVIEHNWAEAFKGAADYSDGEYKLPFDRCAFEFRVSGRRVIVIDTQDSRMAAFFFDPYWIVYPPTRQDDPRRIEDPEATTDKLHALSDLVENNVRAICVALEAEIAVTDTVRAPFKLNASREKKGKPPLSDYHVVSLARRQRAAPLPGYREPETGKVRLHFRRGHWRHYEDHKTWIKWTLVGNPDLGFINKHYRL